MGVIEKKFMMTINSLKQNPNMNKEQLLLMIDIKMACLSLMATMLLNVLAQSPSSLKIFEVSFFPSHQVDF